jgi:predicted transcriptional regulator
MADPVSTTLSRRERQVMDIILRLGQATAGEVQEGLPDRPSYSAVRATLRLLVRKGHLKHQLDWPRYVYSPTVSRTAARKSALKQMVRTFFGGSHEEAMAALIDLSASKLSSEQIDKLHQMIDQAKEEGR